jgi:hypothetical protein
MSKTGSSVSSVEEPTFPTFSKSLGDMPQLATRRDGCADESGSISTIATVATVATIVEEREPVLAEPLSDDEEEYNTEDDCGVEWTQKWHQHQASECEAEKEIDSLASTSNSLEMIRKLKMLRQLYRIQTITRKQWKKQTNKILESSALLE